MDKDGVIAGLTLVSIMSTIIVGGFVRAYKAGMACGVDWPSCNGRLLPLDQLDHTPVLLEYVHRVIGGIAFMLTLYTTISFTRNGGRMLSLLSVMLLSSMIIQVLLGLAVIRSLLNEYIVAFHLSFASLSLMLSSIIYAVTVWGKVGG